MTMVASGLFTSGVTGSGQSSIKMHLMLEFERILNQYAMI